MLIILDRDGVINYDSDDYIKSPEEWVAIPNSLEAIARLNRANHTIVVATNQSGVGRGYFSLATLEKIHQKMQDELAKIGGTIAKIFICPHTPNDYCECRKPSSGLFQKIANDFNVDLTQAISVGDSLRDIQAAQAAHCPAVLVKTGKGETTIAVGVGLSGIPIYEDLNAFVTTICR